jgi:hypothetical protein
LVSAVEKTPVRSSHANDKIVEKWTIDQAVPLFMGWAQLIVKRFVIKSFFVKHKAIGDKTKKGLFYHSCSLLLIVQTYFGGPHGKLPALYFQQRDPAFL